MDGLQVAEQPSIIPKGTRISDMARAPNAEHVDAFPEIRWRGALLEIAADVLRVIHQEVEGPAHSIWKEEARLRANGFLQLALVDSVKAMPPRKGSGDCKLDLRSVSKLAHCYRSLQHSRLRGLIECENILQDAFFGLAAAYQPAVRNLDLQISLCPMLLRSDQCRALVLFMSCVVQGILRRASGCGGDGQALLKLSRIDPSTGHLLVQTSDPVASIFISSEYQIASRLAGALAAEFVCRQGTANGSILEMRFSTNQCQCSTVTAVIGSQDYQGAPERGRLVTTDSCLADVDC
jgi:hypothetical protein